MGIWIAALYHISNFSLKALSQTLPLKNVITKVCYIYTMKIERILPFCSVYPFVKVYMDDHAPFDMEINSSIRRYFHISYINS